MGTGTGTSPIPDGDGVIPYPAGTRERPRGQPNPRADAAGIQRQKGFLVASFDRQENKFSCFPHRQHWTTSRRALEATQSLNPLTNDPSFEEIVWGFKL
jgi:hypothetical protein